MMGSMKGFGLSLLMLWFEFLVFATCQSTTTATRASSQFDNYVATSKSFPDEGNIQSFAPGGDDDTLVPPPPYEPYSNPTRTGKAPNGLEILVAIFFFVAAAWLLIAVFYALLALIVLRLRSRGLLNLNDDEFGRLYLFQTRLYIPCGCILRRYVVAFGHDQPTRHSRGDDARGISRSERRKAVEKILFGRVAPNLDKRNHQPLEVDEEMGCASSGGQTSDSNSDYVIDASNLQEPQNLPSDHSHSQSSEEPVCSICLAEYEDDDQVFHSDVCNHMYHSECILDWLERRSNTDCPCCRQPLVSEDAVWESVQLARKLKQATEKKKDKQKKRRWKFASLTSEVNVAVSNNRGSRQGESGGNTIATLERQSTVAESAASTTDYSRRHLMMENYESCYADGANGGQEEQPGLDQTTETKVDDFPVVGRSFDCVSPAPPPSTDGRPNDPEHGEHVDDGSQDDSDATSTTVQKEIDLDKDGVGSVEDSSGEGLHLATSPTSPTAAEETMCRGTVESNACSPCPTSDSEQSEMDLPNEEAAPAPNLVEPPDVSDDEAVLEVEASNFVVEWPNPGDGNESTGAGDDEKRQQSE